MSLNMNLEGLFTIMAWICFLISLMEKQITRKGFHKIFLEWLTHAQWDNFTENKPNETMIHDKWNYNKSFTQYAFHGV